MTKYRLLPKTGGHHSEGSRPPKVKHYKSGDVVESDENLVALFPLKFEKVTDNDPPGPSFPIKALDPSLAHPKKKKELEPPPVEEEAPEPPPPPPPVDMSSFGMDVTKKFKDARQANMLVYQLEDGTYNVAYANAPTVLINEEPLKHKEVIKLIGAES